MTTSKKFFNDLRMNRKKFSAIAVALLLIVLFQNCGGPGLNAGSSIAGIASSSTDAGASLNTNNSLPPSGLVPPVVTEVPVLPGLTLAQQTANCNSAIGNPNILSITSGGAAASAVSVNSGLGTVLSGDSKTPPAFEMTINRGVTNPEVYNSPDNKCDSHVMINLRCDVVAADPGNPSNSPLAISNAIDIFGNSLLSGDAMLAPLALARTTFKGNNCSMALNPGASTVTFSVVPDSTKSRCVQGTFWLRLTVQSSITGINGNKTSTAKYFKVSMNNGCWAESKLKDSAGNLPSVVNFGTAVAISGNWAAVLAPTDDANSTVLDVGSVYMYMYNGSTWVQKQKIMIGDSAARESLASIALRGDTLILGSPYRNARGMAYFYRRNGETWTQIQQIDPANTSANQAFGQAVALNDGYVFIGSPSYSGTLVKAGAVSIYRYTGSGMTYVKTLFGASANAAFGAAIAVDGQNLAVGAPQAIGKEGLGAGSVFVYSEAAGAFNLASTKTGVAAGDKFGASLAVYGKHLAVGSPNFSVRGVGGFGAVTYYDDYSVAAATKTIPGTVATDNLGQGVALSSSGLYIGVPYANARAGRVDHYLYAGIAAGTVYFRNLAYSESGNSAYGYAVAASGSDVIIGARIKNDPNDNSGAAYIYRFK